MTPLIRNNIFSCFVLSILCTHSYGQNEESLARKSQVIVGLNVNPFLYIVYNAVEIGPSISYSYRINNHFEIGATLYTRQQFFSPKNEFGKANNISTTINLESVFTPQVGVVLGKKRIKNKFLAFGGFRHDYYKEELKNAQYGINENYQYTETNLIFGLGYQLQYQFTHGNGLSFRILIPINRNPLDDANRYSLEFGYSFLLKQKIKT